MSLVVHHHKVLIPYVDKIDGTLQDGTPLPLTTFRVVLLVSKIISPSSVELLLFARKWSRIRSSKTGEGGIISP